VTSFCLCLCLSISLYLSVTLSIRLSVYPSIRLSISPSVFPSLCLSVYVSLSLSLSRCLSSVSATLALKVSMVSTSLRLYVLLHNRQSHPLPSPRHTPFSDFPPIRQPRTISTGIVLYHRFFTLYSFMDFSRWVSLTVPVAAAARLLSLPRKILKRTSVAICSVIPVTLPLCDTANETIPQTPPHVSLLIERGGGLFLRGSKGGGAAEEAARRSAPRTPSQVGAAQTAHRAPRPKLKGRRGR
jgi:hypothetical protein